ncbi:MAG: transcription-repair coupling factor [Zetaproteobacteria bacterium CG_4_10_14_0_2_um_filter_55_20]|nr:MAG: transcription-repair coupling factor [Zetaproteobacteria bacterium CG1_02_55_237]PIS18784.1 MAG: transcription-repair coupling factor [Zetaproteobacteria bacterium CG08_land_8_20_14_0_20_55_17]PIY54465.1 MAG: transcription-repair coupling factor [Zetaproteobacteria bacterium CG_4_10_14_0_8_um_filter_55_43]PIZ38219.1 MAG: transcription-repair coupling factor [Zetaproteobacteria bacterium CG_4_10_14_0_2_um_filter_55_20]PJB82371.1 MAG: transcription-repair coupling factor [Zetaproteobacter
MAGKCPLRHDSPPMQSPVQSNPPGLAFQLAALARTGGLHVYICEDLRSYRLLSEELSFFLQDEPQLLWRFPAWEVLPYDRVSPHHAIVGERFSTLARLLRDRPSQGLLLTALPAWLQRIAPPASVAAHVWQLKTGDTLDITLLKDRLSLAGMQSTERVLDRGEFAARGGILDVWPATEDQPLRLDMFGDTVDSIRRFDVETQRSGELLDHFISVPVREVILDDTGKQTFAAAFRARFPHLRKHPMLTSAEAGRPHPGIESLLPLAYEQTARLADYLPSAAKVIATADVEAARLGFAAQVRNQFDMVRTSTEPLISPQELFAVETPIHANGLPQSVGILPPPSLSDFQQERQPLHAMHRALAESMDAGWRLLLVAHGPGQQERMLETCAGLPGADKAMHCRGLFDLPAKGIAACIGFLDQGLLLEKEKIVLLTGRELLGQRLPRKRGRSAALVRANVFSSLQELNTGDAVVHEDHGVGRYKGLISLPSGDIDADFLHIEYDGASIYVPVEDLDRLHRYTGEDNPALNRLGSDKWKRTRQRVERDLLEMAHELIDTEAARKQVKRPPCLLSGEAAGDYDEFAALFPFEETDDQVEAIDAVLRDLAADTPMDRVVCGDVGFGKTEVAMRAAFCVARCGRQVAIMAPTTVLANQHFANFVERFSGSGFGIEMMTRLQGKKEAERITRELKNGKTRIIIGTHRLLSETFEFADLGLVIVDEEQRFGVKHKEKLKALHAACDLLTLTATPIPRTLHQTLSGLRSVSIISTPPAEREPIRTMVSSFDPHLANEAIRREMYRGGQVYYLHNHVKSIDRIAARLREEVPEAEIGIAHGQMSPTELDRQMMHFYEGRLHVLVCTTIIESGLDVPNANTLIVERADMLGLAQLHQIRGRVGRSHHQAYAYLFTPDARAMTADARERLQAIAQHTELGAGFMLARHDMEIRGAGNLLGEQQSGQIEAIGLDLYLDMLSRAVAESRGAPKKPKTRVEMRLNANTILPPDYIPQIGERLSMYRRIARIESDEQASLLFEEMTDRFGKLPDAARMALEAARLRWRTAELCISRLDISDNGIRFGFTAASPIDIGKLLQRVQREPKRFRLSPDGNLTLLKCWDNQRASFQTASDFLDELLAA